MQLASIVTKEQKCGHEANDASAHSQNEKRRQKMRKNEDENEINNENKITTIIIEAEF